MSSIRPVHSSIISTQSFNHCITREIWVATTNGATNEKPVDCNFESSGSYRNGARTKQHIFRELIFVLLSGILVGYGEKTALLLPLINQARFILC